MEFEPMDDLERDGLGRDDLESDEFERESQRPIPGHSMTLPRTTSSGSSTSVGNSSRPSRTSCSRRSSR